MPAQTSRTIRAECAVCGGTDLRPHFAVAGDGAVEGLIPTTDRFGTALADVVRCQSCEHMQLDSFPRSEELESAYAVAESFSYVDEEAGQRETARMILERVERFASPPGRFLDLGCWVGFLLSEAERRGWDPLGVEPSEFASRFAREELGLEVQTADLLAADLEEGSFDAVFLGDVIEHLIEPVQALSHIRGLLAPGGVVALTLPDAGSRIARLLGRRWWSVIPTHLHYFTRESIFRALERAGLEPIVGYTSPKAFSVGYYLGRLGGYSPGLGRGAVGVAAAVGVAERMWAPDLRDRMLVMARRPSS